MSARQDRIAASDNLDDVAKALSALTALAGKGLISAGLAKRMGALCIEMSQAAEELARTDSGVVVQFGRPNKLARAPRVA